MTPFPFNGDYFYPPRTDASCGFKADNATIRMWMEFPDAVAQLKANGDRCMIFISPDRKIALYTRHRYRDTQIAHEDHQDNDPVPQNYELTPELRQEILALAPEGFWAVFDAELLHKRVSDTPTLKNVLMLFDVLVWKAQHLFDSSYAERYSILLQTFRERYGHECPIPMREAEIKPNSLYLAQNILAADWAAR